MAKIMLVEDNPAIRNILMRRLLKRGYDVVCAEDAPPPASWPCPSGPT